MQNVLSKYDIATDDGKIKAANALCAEISAIYSSVEQELYTEKASVSEVIVYKNKNLLHKFAEVILHRDKLVLKADGKVYEFPFSETSAITVLGKNKLNIYHNKKVYQLKSDKRFNALKYVNLFNRYKNIAKGEKDGEFLGL